MPGRCGDTSKPLVECIGVGVQEGRLFRLEYLAFLSVLEWLEELGHMEEL